jgi:hypothetical protein
VTREDDDRRILWHPTGQTSYRGGATPWWRRYEPKEDTVAAEDLTAGGSEADRQEQGVPDQAADTAPGGTIAGTGTGGSEADLQEQAASVQGESGSGGGIAGEGTGGSEADRLEQAADVPIDGDDAFPYGGTDDSPTA